MSSDFFDRNYVETVFMGPLRARPAGERAALGMGIGATLILAAAALVIHPPAPAAPLADAGAAAAVDAPQKISTKASMALESGLGAKNAALDIDAPEFDGEKKVLAAGETRDGEPRVDSLTIGEFAGGTSFLRVDVHPDLDPRTTNVDFFLDMKNHAQTAGLNVTKIGQRSTVTTRFGAFETADIRLSRAGGESGEAGERACLATRLVDAKVPLEIAGVACSEAAKPMDRVALSCILDKLSYSAGLDNKPLNDFFLNSEFARGRGCGNVSRDDMTASIPPHRVAQRSKPTLPAARPASQAKKTVPPAKKPATVAHTAPLHIDPEKN